MGRGPEAALLLGCARLRPEAEPRERIAALAATDLDWELVHRLAARHGLVPLLHRQLEALAPASLPRPVFVELWAHHERLRRRNAALADALTAVLDALAAAGIPALPYKGPALALELFDDLSLREFGDLDLLLRPRDLPAAQAALRTLGYAPEFDLAPDLEAAFLRSPAQYHLVLAREGLRVELHWKTDPDYPVEAGTDAWWAGLGTAAFGAGRIRRFPPQELLLVLALHGSKHHWSSLRWLVDVAELLRGNPDLDWAWVWRRAGELRATRRLALGLLLAERLLEAPLPEDVRRRLAANPGATRLADRLAATLFDPDPPIPGAFARLRRDLALHEGLGAKAAFTLHTLFAPSLAEWTRWPLPRSLHVLYVPLRLGRLVFKHGGGAAGERS
ncbi:MAG: nucleotidyltransferase family protein [Holophagaceae bacterium]|nr:nucleotidyltransferase family protein [Holophagaceae bacterium]